jgi:hypothetical protein
MKGTPYANLILTSICTLTSNRLRRSVEFPGLEMPAPVVGLAQALLEEW